MTTLPPPTAPELDAGISWNYVFLTRRIDFSGKMESGH